MKTIDEIKEWLLENAVDDEGDLYLIGLDFSDFDGNVYICNMKVKKNLFQNGQKVGEDLHQDNQNVGENLSQDNQKVGKDFYNHKLNKDEYWEEEKFYVIRRNGLKEITLEELEKMGYKLKESIN